MKNFYVINIALCFFCSCNLKQSKLNQNEQYSVILNNRSLNIYTRNLFDKDSLNRALILLDSAISLNKDINFYYSKYAVLRRLGEYKMAIGVCDSIFNLNSDEFRAVLYKGFLYEDLNLKDSENVYYRKALGLVNNTKLFKFDSVIKERERLIILGLLKDTTAYRTEFEKFKIKYSHVNNYMIQLYVDELQNFDRKRYLSDY